MNKPRGRPFQPGNTFGRGRPKGRRNREGSSIQDLLKEFEMHLMRKCIASAMQGDASAMRICMARISPMRRDDYIRVNLPPIKTPQDLDRAAEKVMRSVQRGDVTPSDGQIMTEMLESRSRLIERVDLEPRIKNLEESAIGKKTDKM